MIFLQMNQYTKTQIIKSIKYWQNKLQTINEVSNSLLQVLIDEFGKNKLISKVYKTKFNIDFFNKCYNILNIYIFSSKLHQIPIYYKHEKIIRSFLLERGANESNIPKIF